MPVTIWITKSIRVALPKTYHQLAVVRGTGCVIIGSSVARPPTRWSTQLPTVRMRRIVVLEVIRVGRASQSVRLGPRAAHCELGSHTGIIHAAAARRPASRPHNTPRHGRGT